MTRFDVGKIIPKSKGLWADSVAYERMDFVKNSYESGYVAMKDVPAGTELSNTEYWVQIYDLDGFANNVTLALQAAQVSTGQASIATQAAETATQQAGIATEQANAASLSKDATDSNKNATDTNVTTVQQYAVIAAEQKSAAENAANRAEAAAASFPMRYYRATVAEMESIATAKQGDLCYVTDYAAHESVLYTYDTTDVDADEINPEWVLLGYLKFADMSREDLLAILQLAAVATSGSYDDLTDKPNRYESFAVISPADGAVTWDYGITDKVKITLTADTALTISNIYNGAVGIMEVYGDFTLALPTGSDTAADYDYIELLDGEHWQYMFMYDGTAFHWTRTVCG